MRPAVVNSLRYSCGSCCLLWHPRLASARAISEAARGLTDRGRLLGAAVTLAVVQSVTAGALGFAFVVTFVEGTTQMRDAALLALAATPAYFVSIYGSSLLQE